MAKAAAGKRTAEPKVQIGAIPYRRRPDGAVEVMLVTTRETQRWIVPKGWPIRGLKGHEAAAREATEEAGLVGEVGKKPVGRYTYWKRRPRDFVLCKVRLYLLAVKDQLRVFCGPSSVFGVPALQLGADGLIDCFPNLWTEDGIAMFDVATSGDDERARAIQAKGRQLTDLFVACGGSLYPATKAAMDMMGLKGGGKPRPPLRSVEGETLKMLERGLRAHGLIS